MRRNRGLYYPFKGFYLKRGRKSRGSYKSEKNEKKKKKKDYCFNELKSKVEDSEDELA
jgi:hypothetical protein